MLILFLLITALGLYLSFNTLKDANNVPTEGKTWTCANPPPGKAAGHKWVARFPDHRGYLICKECGKFPEGS